jgi:hypothetical protein
MISIAMLNGDTTATSIHGEGLILYISYLSRKEGVSRTALADAISTVRSWKEIPSAVKDKLDQCDSVIGVIGNIFQTCVLSYLIDRTAYLVSIPTINLTFAQVRKIRKIFPGSQHPHRIEKQMFLSSST